MNNNKFATINFFIETLCYLRTKSTSSTHQARIQTYGLDYANRILKIRTMTRRELIKEINFLKIQCNRCSGQWQYRKIHYEYQNLLLYARNRKFTIKKGVQK